MVFKKITTESSKKASDPVFEFCNNLNAARHKVHIIQIFDEYMGEVFDYKPYTLGNYGS